MTGYAPHPAVRDAAKTLEEYATARGGEAQVFWAPLGAVVLTDNEVYEVYTYGSVGYKPEIIIQSRDMDQADGWRDITRNVLQ